MQRLLTFLLLLFYLSLFSQQDIATVMYYNVLNYPGSTSQRVTNFKTINRYVNPDIILITELGSDAGAQLLLQQGLNVYGETKYQKAAFTDGPDANNMLFYNTNKFTLYSQDTIGTELRVINEYILYYKLQLPASDTIFLYLYVAHLKASTGFEQQRLAEVAHYKSHVNSNPQIENMIIGGDFNFYAASSEPAYDALLTEGLYPLNDVLAAGNWHDNSSYASIHTQSTRTVQFGGGASGGLDDRFDFSLFTNDLLSGSHNITYIANSCKAVGNDGQHLNKAIIETPLNTSVPDSVLQALYNMSDHLPVVSKFLIQPDVVQQNNELSLKVFLEGPFNTTQMSSGINSILPLTNPYSGAPWFSNGGESVSSIPNNNITDWILIELRDAANPSSAHSGTAFDQQAAFLLRDGTIKGMDGISNLQFNHTINQQLYLVIYHRNHLAVMSASGLNHTGYLYSYNFTDGPGKAYGGNNALKQLSASQWGMIAGDIDANGLVNENDKAILWNTQVGRSGYLSGDLNFDGTVNNQDKNDLLIINYLRNTSVPE
jgi:hypothetical protein